MSFFNNRRRLWKEGESTLGYTAPQRSFSKEKRFKLHSIYWPQKSHSTTVVNTKRSDSQQLVRKISKMIDQEEKNQQRMGKGKNSFRKTIKSAQNKQKSSTFRQTKTIKLSNQNQQIIQRLTRTAADLRQSKLRDRHGNRTNLLENQEEQFFQKLKDHDKFTKTQKGFYTSRRMKLQLPHNYYPGPGSYEIKRYLEQRPFTQKIK